MLRPWLQAWFVLGAVCGVLLCSCGKNGRLAFPGAPTQEEAQAAALVHKGGPASMQDVGRAQSEVMDFTDDFTVALSEAIDAMEHEQSSREARLAAHKLKYTVAHGATIIAASSNPHVAVLDMVVMISLQRALIERALIPQVFGDRVGSLPEVFAAGEAQIRGVAAKCFTAEQLAEVDALIDQWLATNSDRRYAAYVRFEEFAAARMATVQPQTGGRIQSLFGLMFVDPLAGLDPATRELEQARRAGERAMFYLQRMPQLVAWQAELLYLDTATEPEVAGLVRDAERVSASIQSVTKSVEELNGQLPELVAKEREAAIDQAFDRFAAERQAMLDDIAARGQEIDRTLASFRETFEAGRGFAVESQALADSIDKLRAAFEGEGAGEGAVQGEAGPAAAGGTAAAAPVEPEATLADYRETLAEAKTLAAELKELLTATESVAKSDLWETRRADLTAAADDVESRARGIVGDVDSRAQAMSEDVDAKARGLIELAYARGLVLVGVIVGGILASVVVSKLMPRR